MGIYAVLNWCRYCVENFRGTGTYGMLCQWKAVLWGFRITYTCIPVRTHMQIYHRKFRHFTSGNSRNFRDSNEALVSSTKFTHTGWDSWPLTLKPHSHLSRAMPAIWVGDWGWHLEGQIDYASSTAWHSKGTKMPFSLLSLVLNMQYTCSASAGSCGIPVQPWFTIPLCSRDPQSSAAASPPSCLSGHQLKKGQRQESTTTPAMAADGPPSIQLGHIYTENKRDCTIKSHEL